MYEYLPNMIKETSDARRADMLREAKEERLANQVKMPTRKSVFSQIRNVVTKMLSL